VTGSEVVKLTAWLAILIQPLVAPALRVEQDMRRRASGAGRVEIARIVFYTGCEPAYRLVTFDTRRNALRAPSNAHKFGTTLCEHIGIVLVINQLDDGSFPSSSDRAGWLKRSPLSPAGNFGHQ
jgi:hypothetical protein